eukprot:SAG31_NODE_5451_length_2531_cov_2.005345_1_plen_28_part_10
MLSADCGLRTAFDIPLLISTRFQLLSTR